MPCHRCQNPVSSSISANCPNSSSPPLSNIPISPPCWAVSPGLDSCPDSYSPGYATPEPEGPASKLRSPAPVLGLRIWDLSIMGGRALAACSESKSIFVGSLKARMICTCQYEMKELVCQKVQECACLPRQEQVLLCMKVKSGSGDTCASTTDLALQHSCCVTPHVLELIASLNCLSTHEFFNL